MSLVLGLWSLWPLISRTGQGGAPTAYISWLKSFATAEETLICIPLKWSFPNILNICKHDRNHYSVFSYCSIMGILKKDLSVWPLFCPATALRFHTMSPCQSDQLCDSQTSHGLPWFQLNRQCSIELIVLSLMDNSFEFLLFMARESELETGAVRYLTLVLSGSLSLACPPKLTLGRHFGFCSIYHFCPLKCWNRVQLRQGSQKQLIGKCH